MAICRPDLGVIENVRSRTLVVSPDQLKKLQRLGIISPQNCSDLGLSLRLRRIGFTNHKIR
jgi:hypothetical protein